MTPAFLRAVLDQLLPQEAEAPIGASSLPGGAATGIDLARLGEAATPALAMIAAQAGGEDAFLAAAPELREAAIVAVAKHAPAEFAALLHPILADYLESAAVLAALGWRAEPPQPAGHALADFDAEARAALEKVRGRVRIWRNAQSAKSATLDSGSALRSDRNDED